MVLCPPCPFQSKFWKYLTFWHRAGHWVSPSTPRFAASDEKSNFDGEWLKLKWMSLSSMRFFSGWMGLSWFSEFVRLTRDQWPSYKWSALLHQSVTTHNSPRENIKSFVHTHKKYLPQTTQRHILQSIHHRDIKLRFGNIYIKFKFVCWGLLLLLWLVPPFLCKTAATNRWLILAIIDWNQVPAPSHCP